MDFERKRYHFSDKINQELGSLCVLDNWHGLLAIATDYLVIFTAILSSIYIHWLYPIAWLVIGSRQRAFATILHESVHVAFTKNRKLNYLLGTFFSGFLIFQSYELYSNSHVKKHHAYLGNKELDPDYKYQMDLNLYKTKNREEKSKNIKFKWPMTYLAYLIKNRMGILIDNSRDALIGRCYLAFLLISICYLGYIKYFIIFWLVPMMTSFLLIGWFLELAEHYPMVHENNIDLYMTRNRFSHWSESLFLSIHNENFHLIHHLRPRIPFWNLKKAHKVLRQDENYRRINESMGGVFLSSNKNTPVVSIFAKSILTSSNTI